jgi:hypothetical protein
VDGEIDFLIFFWDPLEPQPHDPDVKALLRMAVVWNIPIACDRASADFIISSPLMDKVYERIVPDYAEYRSRPIPGRGSRPRRQRRRSEPSGTVPAPARADSCLQALVCGKLDWRTRANP